VLFDGVCALCDASVRWLLAADTKRALHYAPLQGETARDVVSRHPELDPSLSTVIYVRGMGSDAERVYERSDAAVEILKDLGGVFTALSWLRLVPRALRDAAYDFIAERRYRWFGNYDACRLPEPDDDSRFLR
jgi:predicted DCC family thiol-disulfide oxidoreductase YuxK